MSASTNFVFFVYATTVFIFSFILVGWLDVYDRYFEDLMSKALVDNSQKDETKLVGLTKLKSAKKKAEIMGSIRASSSMSSALSDRGLESEITRRLPSSPSKVADRYLAECHVLGLTPQRSIAEVLSRNEEVLDLSHCVLGPLGAIPIFRALKGAVHIRHLVVSGCGLDDSAVLVLVDAASTLSHIQSIDLSNNVEVRHVAGYGLQRLCATLSSLQQVLLTGTNVRGSTMRSITATCQSRLPSQPTM